MDGEDVVNSSDQEFDRPNPLANVGSRAIQEMLDTAFDDRMSSKRFSKELQRTEAAPGTQVIRDRWEAYFLAFYENTLCKEQVQSLLIVCLVPACLELTKWDLSVNTKVPTGEDIERFLPVITKRIRGYGKDGAPAFSVIKEGLRHVITCLQFRFKDFILNKSERLRLTSCVNKLHDEGKITQISTRDRHWVTAQIVTRLVSGMFAQALTGGTLSWDVTISRALSILLQSALACRAGEVGFSQGYDHLFAMRYEHIEVKVVFINGQWQFIALVDVLFTKTSK